jgi:hypothetical protein
VGALAKRTGKSRASSSKVTRPSVTSSPTAVSTAFWSSSRSPARLPTGPAGQ